MKIIKLPILAILLASLMFNCGGKEEKKKEGFSYERTNSSEANESKETDSDVANIVLTSNDVMQYNLKEIKAKAGQKVKLTLRHIGKLDINVMGHNVVILKQGVDLTEFAGKAAIERENKYIPKDSQDIIAHTDLIGGGQVTSIEFVAPEAGTYDFLCSFPGHSGIMKGKFIVE
ncbi:plastocyanin/azurin family copper-binding protein [Algibacter luteus]|uniref:Azurin n=1 Tax=Algibacter luteus TaxID=1178825 RepID=A0A1M6F4L2_9FLAO|nr:azurin [Algibacter luteus]WJJ96692.1 azurin [Algibacter luteus]SHI92606.1 azurin [Algibacter luteus]